MDATLLHLDPNSPEAQVFYQLGRSSNQSDGSPAPSPSGNVINIHDYFFISNSFDIVESKLNLWVISLATSIRSSTCAKSEGTSGQDKNEGCYGPKRWFGMEIVIGRALTWCFISSHLFI